MKLFKNLWTGVGVHHKQSSKFAMWQCDLSSVK